LTAAASSMVYQAMKNGLPKPLGPYSVGSVDIKDKDSDLVLSLFYPTGLPLSKAKWSDRDWWLPGRNIQERVSYAKGYIQFSGLPSSLWPFMKALGMVQLSAIRNAPLLDTIASFPVVLFSHGLGGSRHTYSSYCIDVASHGFVVVAIEHRDGTAPVSVRADGSVVHYKPLKDNVENPRDRVQEFHFRNTQLQLRVDEVLNPEHGVLALLEKMNAGDWKSPETGVPSFAGRLDLENNLHFSGHSFGSATALASAYSLIKSKGKYASALKSCLALDVWMFPIPVDVLRQPELKDNRQVRIAFINNEKFQWDKNLERIAELSSSEQVTLKHAAHQTQSDILVLIPGLVQSFLGLREKADATHHSIRTPLSALQLSNRMSASFLKGNTCLHDVSAEDKEENLLIDRLPISVPALTR